MPKNVDSLQIQKVATYDSDRNKINLILNTAFTYYNLQSQIIFRRIRIQLILHKILFIFHIWCNLNDDLQAARCLSFRCFCMIPRGRDTQRTLPFKDHKGMVYLFPCVVCMSVYIGFLFIKKNNNKEKTKDHEKIKKILKIKQKIKHSFKKRKKNKKRII